ncbi:aminoacyl--tRNA ligase-related protein [Mycobacterium avium]|uniref:aminoacyl--tRNA ligase-related protein n=1 Tax=Mycobacterium avium TaxID=1764 RepID=UPI001C52838C|nr:aminoacyl--tRNA ligase-related protein [Mycobacterium avium]
MNESVAAASDHRILNNDLEIYATNPLVGAGLALWLPDGAIIRQELEALARDIAAADGCRPVYSPVLAKRELFERSGHWEKFADDMFPPMRVGGEDLVLRPANCPHHAMIFAAQQHSYRQLPIRLHQLGAMFRAERSGVLSGLARVRQICLDDTHVFCRPDQVADEVARGLHAILNAQQVLGLPVDYVRLSLRDDSDNYLGPRHRWQMAEQALRDAATQVLADAGNDLALIEAAGEAAIYGPKLDIQVRDPAGHEESIATVQLDFNQPERFNLHYTDAAGSRQPVVMIHRGTIGSMERVVAALIEHYRGRLPLWLAPNQIQVLPVSPNQHPTHTTSSTTYTTAAYAPTSTPKAP